MAGSSLLALLDDIASLLDDVAVLTKVSTQKTAGVLGDDLALNAQQVTGVNADRELPVVWAVAKGSARNKLILVPAALAISAFAHWAVTPLLMLGGAYLCFEGCEKLLHKWLVSDADEQAEQQKRSAVLTDPATDVLALERDKVKGAIRTDFVLSAEIIAITLGVVAEAPFTTQLSVLSLISLLMTVGVYGLVAGIVKLDDLGLTLSKRGSSLSRAFGAGILRAAPYLMKTLSIGGTVAMFLVGGGILRHGIPPLEAQAAALAKNEGVLGTLLPMALDGAVGLVAGALLVALVMGVKKALGKGGQ